MSVSARRSQLEQAIAAYRQRLLALDAAALGALETAYAPGRETILQTIAELVRQIEQAGGAMTPAEAMRLSRAAELLERIEAETARLAQLAGRMIPQAQQAAIRQAIERARVLVLAQAPDAQVAAHLARQWAAINPRAVERLVGAMSDGAPLNEWLRGLAPDAVDAARSVLADGVARGIHPRDLAARLQRVARMPLHRAMSAARDLTMDAYTGASLQLFAENADVLRGWQWSSAKQERTCLACLALDDGTVYPLTQQFFPRHARCRCSPIPVLDDPDGLLPPIETGAEWFAKLPEADRLRMVPLGLQDDVRTGRVRLEDMRTLERDPVYGDRWRQATVAEARAHAARRRSRRTA